MPSSFLKNRVKEACSVKPTFRAMSLMLALPLISMDLAVSMVTRFIQFSGERPLTFFTIVPNRLALRFSLSE